MTKKILGKKTDNDSLTLICMTATADMLPTCLCVLNDDSVFYSRPSQSDHLSKSIKMFVTTQHVDSGSE